MKENTEIIKVILKFKISKIYEMLYLSDMELSDIMLMTEKISHIFFNKDIFSDIQERGTKKYDKLWAEHGELILKCIRNSPNSKYYHDSLMLIEEINKSTELNQKITNRTTRILFIIILILTKKPFL